MCLSEEVEPELKVVGLFPGESDLLLIGAPILDSKAKPVEEVPGRGDDVGGMVEATNRGIKITKGCVARVCVFVIREGHQECLGVEEPAEDNLGFNRGAFCNEFGGRQDAAPGNRCCVPCMWVAGEVHGEGGCMGAVLAVDRSVKDDGYEVINEAIGAAGDGHWDREGEGPGRGKRNGGSKEGRLGGNRLGWAPHCQGSQSLIRMISLEKSVTISENKVHHVGGLGELTKVKRRAICAMLPNTAIDWTAAAAEWGTSGMPFRPFGKYATPIYMEQCLQKESLSVASTFCPSSNTSTTISTN
jgi:hypothetical protein